MALMLNTATVLAASPDVVIGQVYGGGGNAGTTYKNDFIELYNRGSVAVSLAGWSVQYASATGTSWQVTNLTSISLQPGQHYLIQEAAGTGGTTSLPTPDATGSIAMSGTNGKVALVTSTTALTCGATASSCATLASVKDSIGYGTATAYEGAAAPALTNTTAAIRAGGGATDTDNNASDFAAGTPNPVNTAAFTGGGSSGAVNGACGSANAQAFGVVPATNLCAIGSASAVSGAGPWSWTCAGSSGGTTASCAATKSSANPFTIFHMNDVHARLTPHKWVVSQHGSGPDVFENVGGAAYVAGKMLSLVNGKPTALVLDGGDISEGNPVGDMNCTQPGGQGCSNNSYGNGGMTTFYELLNAKLTAIGGRSGRGIDALVVGNHDVRDLSYISNMEHMASTGVPVISANVRDLSCTASHPRYPRCEHFPPYTTVTVNGVKVGILGYTTSTATVGASLANTLTVVDCQWTGSPTCNIAPYVNELRNNLGAQIVILLTHDGHGDLIDPTAPVLADTADAKVPEIAITGHWHTWAETVWQPYKLNYKTLFAESGSYMKYIGEVNVSGTGQYVSAAQHVLRNSTITPDPDIQAFVENLKAQFQASAGFPVDQVVGYTNDDLLLDSRMKWWSADEYPWSGNNTAGQWITDAMKWKCDQIWSTSGGCDLAIEAGGGVRSDIPAGAVTYLHVYETFPWADDTYVRISMTGQDIINFIKTTNLDTGFSRQLDVTAKDGIITQVLFKGAPIGLSTVYKVAINNYMQAHPPGGYTWPTYFNPEADPANGLVRTSLIEFMQQNHGTPQTGYSVGGDRYHFNGEYAGGYRVVVTMLNDADSKPAYEDAFIRMLSANPETLGRRGGRQVPSNLVNADGSVNAANRLAEQQLYRSILGVKKGALKPGDIIEVFGKASFYGGNPEFVDQEGVYGDGVEFKVLGHDDSLAKPAYVSSIATVLSDDYKNHYVKFLATKTASDTVKDQTGATLKIWDRSAYAAATLPGNVGDTLAITGVVTMESFGSRFRSDQVVVSSASLPAVTDASSHVNAQPTSVSGAITLSATAAVAGTSYALTPVADAQVASGSPGTNYGSSNNLFIQSSSATGTFGVERAWLKFDLSGLPAGTTIASATLELYNWKSTGASMPVEVRSATDDTWTETGLNYGNQPGLGAVLDTKTLAAGVTNQVYGWDTTSFVQSQLSGDKLVSLMLKPADEALSGGPSYGFDAKEYGSNGPVLRLVSQPAASTIANVKFFYRYSADNLTWGAWTQSGAPVSGTQFNTAFSFPNGEGYYEFYSVAVDNLGQTESTPPFAQASAHYAAATGQSQSIAFTAPASAKVNSSTAVAASASSGLPVSLSVRTPAVCQLNGATLSFIAAGTCTLLGDQTGAVGYYLPASSEISVTVTADVKARAVPLPEWALFALGLVLLSTLMRAHYRRARA